MSKDHSYFLGVDVGTGSARAGLFDQSGTLMTHHTVAIQMWHPQADFVEQSSENIWQAIRQCVHSVMQDSGVAAAAVRGIGFDATCSLVAVDAAGKPVTVSPDGNDEQNVIVWMDHRALEGTEAINRAGDYPVYEYVGGKISPEMETPKLLWLKKHLPHSWQRAAHFFDLPDYLTYRATGALTRSLCSTTCKWTYLAHEAKDGTGGWHEDFFKAIGLEDLVEEKFQRLGTDVQPMGQPVGEGLSRQAAEELGLLPGTAVGVSIIDAHAGGVGMIGLSEGGDEPDLNRRLALIGGTSSCHMAVAPEARPIPGVWGPYYSAMVPGLWLNEGGQSATGALVDHMIFNHAAYPEALKAAEAAEVSIYQYLNEQLVRLAQAGPLHELTRDLHVCPYFHGNRSPRADPELRGMISGLRLSATLDDLCRLYLATVQAIAYGTRHIIEEMNRAGYEIDTIVCCGGGTKNSVFLQQHADITGCRLILPKEPEAVLLGAAMLGAVAAGQHPSISSAMAAMSCPGQVMEPELTTQAWHQAKYRIFHKLYEDQMSYRTLMNEAV